MFRNLFYSILISLILVTPFIWSNELYNGLISAKQIWFFGAMALLIFGFALDILFSRKRLAVGFNLIDISLLIFYTYFLIRTYYTPYTPILYNQKFINYSLLVLFYFIVKYACRGSFMKNPVFGKFKMENPLIMVISLVLMVTGLMEAIWGLMQLYGLTRSFHSGFKITGTFFNPAPYALYLAVIFPIALSLLMRELKNEGIKELRNERNIKNEEIKELRNERIKGFTFGWIDQLISLWLIRYQTLKNEYAESPNSFIFSFLHSFIQFIPWLTVISILLVLPATMNRASWVGVGISSLFIFNQKYRLTGHLQRWLKTGIRKIIIIVGLLTLVAIIGTGLYQFKKGSSIGRLFIWEVTAGKIADRPLFGYGVGRFEAEYNNWQAEYFKNHPEEMDGPKGIAAGNTKYCFNEYLEMTSEIGIIGLFLFLMIFLSLLISRIRDEFSRKHFIGSSFNAFISSSSFILSFFHCFISLFVCALISYPFYSLSTLILLFLLLAMISSGIPVIEKFKLLQYNAGFQYGIRLASLFLLAPVVFFLFNLTKEQYLNGFIMDEGVKLYRTQCYNEACQSFDEVYSSLKYDGPYLQYYGKALSMKGDYNKGVEVLERAGHFTSDEILYTNLGNSYDSLKRYSCAEAAYLHASAMVPHKLYPLYLLANLYEKNRKKTKAMQTGKMVLSKRIKVESSATSEIKSEMKSLIERVQIKEQE